MIFVPEKNRMNLEENRQREAFTLIELLVVIGIIAILAAITTGVIGLAKGTSQEKQITAKLDQLVTAIEQYKSKVGYYPPDHQLRTASGNPQYTQYGKIKVNPVLNSLYYELNGSLVEKNAGIFVALGDAVEQGLTQAQVEAWFGVDGIHNSAVESTSIKSIFDGIKSKDVVEVEGRVVRGNAMPGRVKLLSVPARWPRVIQDRNPLGNTEINVWRYNSSNPTNNPASYDLWAEIPIQNDNGEYELKVIGNW